MTASPRPLATARALRLAALVAFVVAGATRGFPADGVGKVGETWIYQHEGIRPLSNPPAPIRGDRTNEIIAVKGDGPQKLWLVKHTWGEGDETPATLHVDPERRIREIEVGTQLTIEFEPPIPLDWTDLKPAESRTLETKLKVMGLEMPLKYEVKRLKDQTVTVPAGEFVDCRHVEVLVSGLDPQGQPAKTRYEYWFSPKVNGLVKEVAVTSFGTDSSRTGTSSLKAYKSP